MLTSPHPRIGMAFPKSGMPIALLALSVVACQPGPTHLGSQIPDTIAVHGVQLTAAVQEHAGRITLTLQMVNATPESATLRLGGCPLALIAFRSAPTAQDHPIWDERDGIGCFDHTVEYPLRSGEQKELTHSIPTSATNGMGKTLPLGRNHFVAGVRLTGMPAQWLLVYAGDALIRP